MLSVALRATNKTLVFPLTFSATTTKGLTHGTKRRQTQVSEALTVKAD